MKTAVLNPDFEKQVEQAFENSAADIGSGWLGTFDDIVDVTTFHTILNSNLRDIMKVKDEIFTQRPDPNWTAVGVTWLAGFDFEIKVIARIPQST